MIEPPPDFIISEIAYFIPTQTPLRLMAIAWSTLFSVGSIKSSMLAMPALLYKMSNLPYISMVVLTSFCRLCSKVGYFLAHLKKSTTLPPPLSSRGRVFLKRVIAL